MSPEKVAKTGQTSKHCQRGFLISFSMVTCMKEWERYTHIKLCLHKCCNLILVHGLEIHITGHIKYMNEGKSTRDLQTRDIFTLHLQHSKATEKWERDPHAGDIFRLHYQHSKLAEERARHSHAGDIFRLNCQHSKFAEERARHSQAGDIFTLHHQHSKPVQKWPLPLSPVHVSLSGFLHLVLDWSSYYFSLEMCV